jgi:hypothetical protein
VVPSRNPGRFTGPVPTQGPSIGNEQSRSLGLELHAPLQRNEWNDTILAAARTHGWTHFLVHKNYTHADMIPLEQTFSNRDYAVYRFAGLAAPPQTAAPGTE